MKNIVIGFCLGFAVLGYADAKPAPPKCSDARNQQVLQHLTPGQKFEDAIAYLDTAGIPYFLSSRKGQAVTPQLIREKGYAAFGSIELIVRSDDGGAVLVGAPSTEMLIIKFDKDAVLTTENCMTYKTGT